MYNGTVTVVNATGSAASFVWYPIKERAVDLAQKIDYKLNPHKDPAYKDDQ